jgi:hypothetical protein
MDNPIVNPIWFYLADTIPNIRYVFIAVGFCLFILSIGQIDNNKVFRKIVVSGFLALVVGAIIPSQETLYKMVAAKMITPNNIQTVSDYVNDTATNVSDNLTDAIKDIMDYSVDRIYNVRNNEKAGD